MGNHSRHTILKGCRVLGIVLVENPLNARLYHEDLLRRQNTLGINKDVFDICV